jgi:ATP-binding cassette subfamily B protein
VRILFDVVDHPPTEAPDVDKAPLELSASRVEFANVQFAYRPGEKVIRNLSFLAEPGKVTALVGPSGGGKSTILNLILRLYEVDGGAITIDGQNTAVVSRHSLRSQVAYVGQDVFLFRGSVRDNISVGRPDATESEIVAAAKAAYAHDFIMAFPRGRPTRMTSSWPSRAATPPRSASTACSSPAASASASRWRVHCSRTRQ